MARYVIAVKLQDRSRVRLSDALSRIATVKDFEIVGDTSGVRTVIEATEPAALQIKQLLANCCHVEAFVGHVAQGTSTDSALMH